MKFDPQILQNQNSKLQAAKFSQSGPALSFGDKKIDDIFNGGLNSHAMHEFYGPAAVSLTSMIVSFTTGTIIWIRPKNQLRQLNPNGLSEIKNNIKNIDVGEISNLHLETNNELDLYFEHIQKLVKPEKVNSQIKFGVDGGNGAIGSIFEDLSTIYNFDCEKLYMEVDGNFPNHPADPSNIDNLKEIIKLVQEKKLDFGVAFDGDADRAVFIDDTGKVVSGSMMTTLIADYLSEKKNNLKE